MYTTECGCGGFQSSPSHRMVLSSAHSPALSESTKVVRQVSSRSQQYRVSSCCNVSQVKIGLYQPHLTSFRQWAAVIQWSPLNSN